jgi:DNA polymerase
MGLAPIWRLRSRATPEQSAEREWMELKQAVPACRACGLHKTRTQTVFGVGDERADWMLIGEAPGAEEDRLGDPFVGQAGKLLDNMLAAIDLKRGENVYIANVLKCRPPGNRRPLADEIERCRGWLDAQLALVAPALVVPLGLTAIGWFLGPRKLVLREVRGRVHDVDGLRVLPTYHPSGALRYGPNGEPMRLLRADLALAAELVRS